MFYRPCAQTAAYELVKIFDTGMQSLFLGLSFLTHCALLDLINFCWGRGSNVGSLVDKCGLAPEAKPWYGIKMTKSPRS